MKLGNAALEREADNTNLRWSGSRSISIVRRE
jgi:hypothetical protein